MSATINAEDFPRIVPEDRKAQTAPTEALRRWLQVRDTRRAGPSEWRDELAKAGYRVELLRLATAWSESGFHDSGTQHTAKTASYLAEAGGTTQRPAERFLARMREEGWHVATGRYATFCEGKKGTPYYKLLVPGDRYRASFGPRKAKHAPVIDRGHFARHCDLTDAQLGLIEDWAGLSADRAADMSEDGPSAALRAA